MARKSRKNAAPKKHQIPAAKIWRAALYVRLSVEFNGKRGDSLETQRQIMEAYAAPCPDIGIAGVYIDNGITGQTFEREAFQRMLQDVEAGEIDCIMVKDLSRLGRNTIDTGYYIEKYFPLHGVRFIAVNDQFDSTAPESSGNYMIVPLKNMINEAYAADISGKVKAQQRQAMRDGEFIGSLAPYGYKKDPANCHHLLVNEDTAPVVRQIFQWTVDGVSLNMIAKRLNTQGAMPPGNYLAHIGLTTRKRLIGSGKWTSWTVKNMLANEVYAGDMVQGKYTNVGHKSIPTDSKDWIIVRDTHEPLVSREMFAQVQAARRQAAAEYAQKEKVSYTPNILNGRVFCGHCGQSLNRRKDSKYYYRCISNDRKEEGLCPGNIRYIPEEELFDTILTIIRQKAEIIMGENLYLKRCDSKIAAQRAAVNQEIAELQKVVEKNRALLATLYGNLIKGVLTKVEYLELQKAYHRKIGDAVARVQTAPDRAGQAGTARGTLHQHSGQAGGN